jgi:ABC-type multidrug transport system fused ATPase/permease subunit
MQNKILQLESKIDPKALYNKCIEVKPKTKFYSGARIALIGLLIFISIILSSLVVGLNFLELNNPNFDKEGFGKINNSVVEPTLSIEDIFDSNPGIPNKKQLPSNTPYFVLILQGFATVVIEITSLILSYSLEFVLIGIFLLITCYWIYRITDWPLTNNKPLLLAIILILTITIGLGFLTIFKEDRRIPRVLRETRDYIREKLNFSQGNY